jgi:hypothetical protein
MDQYSFATAPPKYIEQIYPQFEIPFETKLNVIKQRYEISPYFGNKIDKLRGIQIVILCDDSGSMNQTGSFDKLFNRYLTRWEELKQRVKIILEIACILDSDGVDIYFLNRSPIYNVKNVNQLDYIFSIEPNGSTPLDDTIKRILIEKSLIILETKLLIIIATDGEPDGGEQGKYNFIKTLHNRKPIENIPISIMACTDDENVMKYLNKIDRQVKYIDVVDDYENEKKEIKKVQGESYPFTLGDYIVKTLIGPIDPELDNKDKHTCIIL